LGEENLAQDHHQLENLCLIKVLGWLGVLVIREGEGGFVEDDEPGDDDSLCGEVKAVITLVIRGVTKEHTQGRAGSKFVRGGGSEIRIA
jgi:hypothetical protein